MLLPYSSIETTRFCVRFFGKIHIARTVMVVHFRRNIATGYFFSSLLVYCLLHLHLLVITDEKQKKSLEKSVEENFNQFDDVMNL